MLKRSYKFQYGKSVAQQLVASMCVHHVEDSKAADFQLCETLLNPLIDKIAIAVLRGVTDTIKVNFTNKMALAFHIAYTRNYINTNCIYVKEIFTVIDRTL